MDSPARHRASRQGASSLRTSGPRTSRHGADVIVVGAGIIGLACARELAARGHSVIVLERSRPGNGASYAAAGMLAPLAEVPEAGPFFDACRDSRDQWCTYAPDLAEETGMALDYDTEGTILVDDPAVLSCFRAAATALGEAFEDLDRSTLTAHLPGLAPELESGLLMPAEHRIDNRAVCRALEASLARRGVSVLGGCAVRDIRATQHGSVPGAVVEGDGWRYEADHVVVAAGAWSGEIALADLVGGEGNGSAEAQPTRVRPVRGEMLAYGAVSWPFQGSVRSAHCYAVRRAGGGLLVGATVDEAGFDDRTTPQGQRELLDGIARLFPALVDKPVLASWSGLRPGTPDGLPHVGPLAGRSVWAATGHYRNGILLAPWTAHWLTRALEGDLEARQMLMPFTPERASRTSLACS